MGARKAAPSHRFFKAWACAYWFMAALGAACSDGTSGWVLSEMRPSPVGTSDAGTDVALPVPDGGLDSEASTAPPLPCPGTFSEVCSPEIVLENRDQAGSGRLFDEQVPEPAPTLTCIARHVCSILYRDPAEVRPSARIHLIVESFAGVSLTWQGEGEHIIRMSSQYLQSVADANRDVGYAILGLLYFHTTNVFQRDDGNSLPIMWVIQGIADYVRHRANFLPLSDRRAGGTWTDGFSTTAFFLAWLDEQYPDFVYRLNRSLDPDDGATWSVQAFQDLTGKGIDTLWTEYQSAL